MIRRSLLAGLLLFAAACSSSGASDTADPLDEAVAGICEATTLAEDGDVAAASEVFQDRSHEYLHELADQLSDQDRAATARLLEAKQRVEAAFANLEAADPAETGDLLRDLQAALAKAATAAGLEAPGCGVEAA